MQVPVNVRDHRDAHRRTVAKALGALLLAAAWAVSAALLWRTEVPRLALPHLDPRDYFPPEALDRIASFRRVSRVLFLAGLGVQIVVLAALVWKAGALADWLAGAGRGRVRTGVLLGLAVVFVLWLAVLPVAAASHWWRRRYGLSEQGYDGWLRDQAVGLGVELVLVALAVGGALWLAGRLGASWWLAGAPALAAAAVLFTLAQPLVVQPLFNRFHPLEDEALAARIEALARREGVPVDKVLVADASRRTTTANAYVAGIGPTKRVVLYDTILDGRFTDGEIAAVAAHELGHVARSHLWKGLAWFALLALPGVYLVAWLTERRGGLPDPALVPLALTAAFAFFLVTQPFQNVVSRRYEAEADWLALEATRDPGSAVALERRFVLTSLGDPEPPAWVTIWLGTHPPPLERIAMAEAYRERVRAAAARAGS
jgi:STE24 endopeptidase